MSPELNERVYKLDDEIKETGNKYELELFKMVTTELCNVPLDKYAYKELDKLTKFITTCTKIYEPKRKRDMKNINRILEIVNIYRNEFYNRFAKKEEELEQANERRAAFKVV